MIIRLAGIAALFAAGTALSAATPTLGSRDVTPATMAPLASDAGPAQMTCGRRCAGWPVCGRRCASFPTCGRRCSSGPRCGRRCASGPRCGHRPA